MTTLTLPPMDTLARAARELAAAAQEAGDKRNEMAINKAAFDLHRGSAPVPTSGGFLVNSSSTSCIYRVDNVTGCNCDAGSHNKPCRHAAQIEIIEHAQRYTMPSLRPLGQRISAARATALVNELFS
jgi:hypothetical protein